jgi:two-component system phosphate regulon sensor histidine kinase PhoR
VHERVSDPPPDARAQPSAGTAPAVWRRYVPLALAAVVVSSILGAIAGPAWVFAFIAAVLAAALVHHLRYAARLVAWLRDPAIESIPAAAGLWDDIFAGLHRLLRRQRQSTTRLSATLDEFRRAGAAMPDGLVILDEADRIEWCNPKAEDHLGLDLGRDRRQSITYMVRQPQFAEYLHGAQYDEPLALRQARGGDRTLSVQLVPYGEREKLLITRDVTELERAETMRRDFVANVSHELRTPLTVLGGFVETLADSEPGAREPLLARSLPLMLSQSLRMQRLVDDLLTLSRLESGSNPLHAEAVDVPLLARALHDDAVGFSAGRHRIALELASGDWLLASEHELRAAFGNLVSNAIRYTPDGGMVTLGWARHAEGEMFFVRDTGIGIERHHIPRLTERFYRVDRGRSRETGGTGLGLAIVKHVLQRHQARLEVTSEPGRGSTFMAIFGAERVLAPGGASQAAASSVG